MRPTHTPPGFTSGMRPKRQPRAGCTLAAALQAARSDSNHAGTDRDVHRPAGRAAAVDRSSASPACPGFPGSPLVRIGLLVACLAGGCFDARGQSVARSQTDGSDTPLYDQALYDQVRWSNDEYIRQNIRKHLDALDLLNRQLDKLKASAPDFKSYLDGGEQSEALIQQQVIRLLDFQTTHNRRFDKWSADDPEVAEFLNVLRMSDRQVGELRALYGHWRLHPLLWTIPARIAGLENHAIPRTGLRLDYAAWSKTAGPDDRRFAFFYFLRKACLVEPGPLRQFIDEQTGFEESWGRQAVGAKRVTIKRWAELEYYTYDYLSPDKLPRDPQRPLVRQMTGLCRWREVDGDFAAFYKAKLGLFADLIREMGRDPSLDVDAGPYLDFYCFLARSFPCISAFDLGKDANGNYAFVLGYLGDRPARAARQFAGTAANDAGGSACFGVNSPVGMAYRLFQRLACGRQAALRKDYIERLIGPLLLLQFTLDNSTLRGEKLAEWPYRDVRVGYKGYWDFCQDLVAHIEQGRMVSSPSEEGAP